VKYKTSIAIGVIIATLLGAAAAGGAGTFYFYSSYQSAKSGKSKAEANMRAAQKTREMLKIELDAAKEKLKGKGDTATGTVGRHPLTGMSPVEVVKLMMTFQGEDLSKFAVKENTNTGIKAEVLVGPLNSEFNKAYEFVKQDGEWIPINVKNVGT
jgi:hypothetical protein